MSSSLKMIFPFQQRTNYVGFGFLDLINFIFYILVILGVWGCGVIYISFYINFLDKNSLKIDYYGKKITLP
jgi:hypothetical protein